MTDELRTLRAELAIPSRPAAARARRRLEAAVAAERNASRPRRSARRWAALAAACVLSLSALVSASLGLLGGGDATVAVTAERPEPHGTHSFAMRADAPDGRLTFAPPEGKDAGMRPRTDTGGWSECGINGCYL
jgi:hypothetical protein